MKRAFDSKARATYFILGALAAFGLMILTGAAPNNAPPPPNYGRYQISSWGGNFGNNAGGCGAFIVDTATGETKTVYSRIYDASGTVTVVNNLKKPFYSIK